MINIDDILQWKQMYGDLFQMQIQEQHFIFRALGREEYKQIIMMDLDLGEFQEALCFNAIIYPQEYDYSNGIAGIAEVLSDGILDAAGLHEGQAKQLLDDFREEMFNYDYQVDALIHEAFPEFALEEISTWSVRRTMFYLSRAEWILRNLKGVSLMSADEEAEYQQMLEEQMAQQQQQQKQPPQQRQIRRELIDGPSEEEVKPKPQPKPQQPAPEGGIQSEEELLAMLAGSGAKVAKPATDMSDVKPELNWFQYMDELKGDFD